MKAFNCQCCGECCRGEMKVFLNPGDLFLIAEFKNLKNTKQLFDESYVIIDKSRNNAPLPRLRFSKGPAGSCPFLENRLIEEDGASLLLKGMCELHPDHKPLVCLLAPFYREVNLQKNEENWGWKTPLPGCPGCSSESEFDRVESRGFSPPEELFERLAAEADFFRKISDRLNAGAADEQIISEFYYFDKNQQRQ